jgi:hypothetical protein
MARGATDAGTNAEKPSHTPAEEQIFLACAPAGREPSDHPRPALASQAARRWRVARADPALVAGRVALAAAPRISARRPGALFRLAVLVDSCGIQASWTWRARSGCSSASSADAAQPATAPWTVIQAEEAADRRGKRMKRARVIDVDPRGALDE